uniref:Uncharacterized protein n=1 Tax=Arundo donax TaxID=35708 RepID=A0A0A9GFY1_ARUDO
MISLHKCRLCIASLEFKANICALFSSSFETNRCDCMMSPKFRSTNKLFHVL